MCGAYCSRTQSYLPKQITHFKIKIQNKNDNKKKEKITKKIHSKLRVRGIIVCFTKVMEPLPYQQCMAINSSKHSPKQISSHSSLLPLPVNSNALRQLMNTTILKAPREQKL